MSKILREKKNNVIKLVPDEKSFSAIVDEAIENYGKGATILLVMKNDSEDNTLSILTNRIDEDSESKVISMMELAKFAICANIFTGMESLL